MYTFSPASSGWASLTSESPIKLCAILCTPPRLNFADFMSVFNGANGHTHVA